MMGYDGIHALWLGEMYDSTYPVTVISLATEDWQCAIRMENQIFYPTLFSSHLSTEICLHIYAILEEWEVKAKHIDFLFEELIGRYQEV